MWILRRCMTLSIDSMKKPGLRISFTASNGSSSVFLPSEAGDLARDDAGVNKSGRAMGASDVDLGQPGLVLIAMGRIFLVTASVST
ncbi:MAG: hypothetical protein Q8L40_01935 [Burkholderiales bacterium]|nr:hypothetical protein [Burkholderiales bacterium]